MSVGAYSNKRRRCDFTRLVGGHLYQHRITT